MAALLLRATPALLVRSALLALPSYWATALASYPRATPLAKLATSLVALMERPSSSTRTNPGVQALGGVGGGAVGGMDSAGVLEDEELQRMLVRALAAEALARIQSSLPPQESSSASAGVVSSHAPIADAHSTNEQNFPITTRGSLESQRAQRREEGAELGRLLVAAIPYVAPDCVHDVEVCVTAVVLALPQTSAQRVALVSLLFSTVSGGLEVERRERLMNWFLILRRVALDLHPRRSRL
jgi:hypothetical protein